VCVCWGWAGGILKQFTDQERSAMLFILCQDAKHSPLLGLLHPGHLHLAGSQSIFFAGVDADTVLVVVHSQALQVRTGINHTNKSYHTSSHNP